MSPEWDQLSKKLSPLAFLSTSLVLLSRGHEYEKGLLHIVATHKNYIAVVRPARHKPSPFICSLAPQYITHCVVSVAKYIQNQHWAKYILSFKPLVTLTSYPSIKKQ